MFRAWVFLDLTVSLTKVKFVFYYDFNDGDSLFHLISFKPGLPLRFRFKFPNFSVSNFSLFGFFFLIQFPLSGHKLPYSFSFTAGQSSYKFL